MSTLRFALLSLATLASCSDDQDLTSGTPQQTDAKSLQVVYEGSSTTVNLGDLSTVDYKGTTQVRMSDIWTASNHNANPATLAFQLEGSDGFIPSFKDAVQCADFLGTNLDKGYVDPSTRNVSWDESLGLRGCYSVDDLAKITAHTPSDADAGTE